MGGGWLPVSLNAKVPREGSVWALDKSPPPPERLCWSTSSPGSHTEGPSDPPAPAGAPPSWTGLTQHRPACRVLLSHRPAPRWAARRAAGGLPTPLSPAPVPGQSPQTRQGRVSRGGGRGLSAGSASYGLNPAWKGRAHSGKAWLLARYCSKPAKCSCHPQAAPSPLQTPSPCVHLARRVLTQDLS